MEESDLKTLINRRRDTIFYVGASAATIAAGVMLGAGIGVGVATGAIAIRETFRLAAWFIRPPKPMQFVGGKRQSFDVNECRAAISVVAGYSTALVCSGLEFGFPPDFGSQLQLDYKLEHKAVEVPGALGSVAIIAGVWKLAGATQVMRRGLNKKTSVLLMRRIYRVPKKILRLYKDVIFDLPRKLDGGDGGTPEWQQWADALTPNILRPSTVPAYARTQVNNPVNA